MLHRFAHVLVRRRVAVLLATLIGLLVAGIAGGGVAARLSNGGFTDPSAESTTAEALLDTRFAAGSPNLVLLVTAPATVDAPASAAAGRALTTALAADPRILSAESYWTLGSPSTLRSTDGRKALVLARIAGTEDEVRGAVQALTPTLEGTRDGLRVQVGGEAQTFSEVGHQIESDLLRAEALAVPLTFLALVLVFGSLVAALLPLAIGAVAVLGTFAVLTALVQLTPVSIFSLNLTTALGLGLAIDYSLFMVSRFREELAADHEVPDAVARTLGSAGRTVLFSALTVLLSLAAMLVFPLYFLRSFAYAGIAVVALAAARRPRGAAGAAGRARTPRGRARPAWPGAPAAAPARPRPGPRGRRARVAGTGSRWP